MSEDSEDVAHLQNDSVEEIAYLELDKKVTHLQNRDPYSVCPD